MMRAAGELRLDEATAVLQRTPSTLRALLYGLPDAWTHVNEGPDTFSAFDVVGHLVHGERTDWMPRARIILAGRKGTFPPFDRFAHYEESRGKTLTQLLDEFEQLRVASLGELRALSLTEKELSMEGVHPAFGAVTLRQLLSTWVGHDLGHIAQIARVMAKRYREDVGPWRAYLPIMDR